MVRAAESLLFCRVGHGLRGMGVFGEQLGLDFCIDRCQVVQNDSVIPVVQKGAEVFRRQARLLRKFK